MTDVETAVASVAQVFNYLDISQRDNMLKDIITSLDDAQSVQTLCEVLPLLNEEQRRSILPCTHEYVFKNMESKQKYMSILKLSKVFGAELQESIIESIRKTLSAYLNSSIVLLDNEFQELGTKAGLLGDIKNTTGMIEANDIIANFTFLEQLFMSVEGIICPKLDLLCLFYTGIDNTDISIGSNKVLRWRVNTILDDSEVKSFLWHIIYALQKSVVVAKQGIGFILWLRYLTNSSHQQLLQDLDFQKIIQHEKYWDFLQQGLISDAHEHRKFSVSILQLSIKAINSSFQNKTMSWSTEESELYLASWRKFTTLFEIIGVDTSLNQARDASGEMVGLLSVGSKIPVAFTLSLLSVGFKASMETVRKFAMNLVFAIPEDSLRLLEQDRFCFLKDHFLKFAMTASNFYVYRDFTNSSRYYQCEFGERLSSFLEKCFKDLDQEGVRALAHKLLELLGESKEAFEPSKTYVALGLWKGLKSRNLEVLTSRELTLMPQLFEARCDGDVYNVTMQTLALRLLLFTNSQAVSLRAFFATLAKFVQHNKGPGLGNGYHIFDLNHEFFLDFFAKNYSVEELLQFVKHESASFDVECMTVVLSVVLSWNSTLTALIPVILAYPQAEVLLVHVSSTQMSVFADLFNDPLIKSKCQRLIANMVQEPIVADQDSSTFELLAQAGSLIHRDEIFDSLSWDSLDITDLWDSISNEIQSDDESVLRLAIAKFGFLSELTEKVIYNEFSESIFTPLNMEKFQAIAFKNQPSRTSKDFYKTKDLFYMNYFNIIRTMTKIVNVEQNKPHFFKLVDQNIEKCGPQSQLAVIKLLHTIYDSCDIDILDTKQVLGFLSLIWQDLEAYRLVLSQKELHLSFIKLLFHLKNLTICSSSSSSGEGGDEIRETLTTVTSDIIAKSVARKSLLPTLVNCIAEFQIAKPEAFESSGSWMAQIIIEGFSLLQSTNNAFLIEHIIGDVFDEEFSLYYGESLYLKVHKYEEISSRVKIAGIIGSLSKPTGSSMSKSLGQQLWELMLHEDDSFRLIRPINRADGYEEWKRIQLVTILLLSVRTLSAEFLYSKVVDSVLPLIFKEPSPLVRIYVEWITAFALLHVDNDHRDKIFEQFEAGITKQHQTIVTSFERICFLMAQQLSKPEESEFLSKFVVETLLPMCTSNRSLVRHFSVSLVVSIYSAITKKGLTIEKSLFDALGNINSNAMRTDNYAQYRSGDALLWDIYADYNLTAICGGVLLRITDREIDFIDAKYFNKYLDPIYKDQKAFPIGSNEQDLFLSCEQRITKPVMDSFLLNVPDETKEGALQTKSGAWATVMNVDDDNDAAAGDADDNGSSKVKRSPLIVVASLVDKPVNLGAICRLCDCLGCGMLTLHDSKVAKNPQFKTVAVTAEQWMPMTEVPIDDVIEFMRYQKREHGYTLIGLEQTDQSIELSNDFKFPTKSLILLGKEREGIPGEMLAELDLCIELRQSGVIRSMNIQSATAVICHAYSIQQ